MPYRILLIGLLAVTTSAAQELVDRVRQSIAQSDFAAGEKLVESDRAKKGVTPENILALSWLGRGALAAKRYDQAQGYAKRTRDLALAELKNRKLDAEPSLPLALGASIEVQAHATASQGERGEAVTFLRGELAKYRNTSIRTRIQKNLHMLSLEGKAVPALDVRRWVGPKPPSLAALRGKPVILYFWAHWCSTCKGQAPDLVRIASENQSKGLVVVGPSQLYGYTAEKDAATPAEELAHIDAVRKASYSAIPSFAVPISQDNFVSFGASTTPTLVFIDPKGIVQVYHPGAMTREQLAAGLKKILPD